MTNIGWFGNWSGENQQLAGIIVNYRMRLKDLVYEM